MLPTDINSIKSRAEALNLSLKKLARGSGVDPSTCYRAVRGDGDNLNRTIRTLAEKVVSLEIAERDRLIALHGVPLARKDAA